MPDIAKKILDGRWGENPAVAKESRPQAPLFRPSHRSNITTDPPSEASSFPRYANVDEPRPRHERTWSADAQRPVRTTSPAPHFAETPPNEDDAMATGLLPVAFRTRDHESADQRHRPLVPVGRRDRVLGGPLGADAPPLQDAVIRPGASARPKDEADSRFGYVLDRLRELGAVYYLLETWGNDGQRFRFHCKMAIAGNSNYTRHFEAIDRDAIQAMGKVLAEVETWRLDR